MEVVPKLHGKDICIIAEPSDMSLTMGEVIDQDRNKWRNDILALCPTRGCRR